MANYEYNKNELVLLNDKLVANSLSDSISTNYGVPTIPSQKLFKESYDKLSSDDKSISDFIEEVISADLYKLSGQYEGTKADVENIQNLSSSYVKVSDFKTTLIDNDGKFLSAEDFDLTYDSTTHDITLKAGEKTYKFSAIEFIQSRTVHHIAVDTHDGKTWLKIFWTADDFIELDINELVKVYTFENGISSYIPDAGGEIHVGATSDLARTSYANSISAYADAISLALNSEIERAKEAEAANTTAISNEKDRAEGAESANATAISNEESRAKEREGELQIAITAEETRAKEAEASLLGKIETENYRATAAEGTNATAISNEKDRAITAENVLDKKIEDETKRAKEEESELKTAIDSEATRAKTAEGINATAINDEKARAEEVEGSLQTQINSVSTDLMAEVETRKNADGKITTDVNEISSDVNSLKSYATALSGNSPDNIGIIATLSNNITTLQSDIIKELKFVNHIRIGNDTPVTTIAAFFEKQNLAVKDGNKVANGSIYDVQFIDGSEYSPSTKYVVEDLSLGLGDYLIVHDHNNDAFVSIADLHATNENKNLYVLKAGTSRYEFENAYSWLSGETDRLCANISDDVVAKYNWLSGETDRLCIAISTAVDLSASALCTELCACELSVDGISTAIALSTAALCTELCACELSVDGISTAIALSTAALYTKISNLSDEVSAISNDLSSAISSKIWIKDLNDDGSTLITGNMDSLSVIKITKDDFDTQVATGTLTMSSNTLYIVSSDYIDAYGQQLCNLTMTEDMVASEAANKHYVDAKYSKLTSDDNFISGEVDRLCSEISNDLTAKYSWLSGETGRLCSEISTAVSLSASVLCTELCACELSVDGLSDACDWLSNNIVTVSNDIDKLGISHQLSVVKISKYEYDMLVADDKAHLCGNAIYVVDSDYMDAYGQVLCNLVMTDDSVPTDAANKHYVDAKDGKLATDINAVSSSVEVIKSKFNDDTIATDPVLAKLLEDKNDSDISTVISAVMYIFNTLTQV